MSLNPRQRAARRRAIARDAAQHKDIIRRIEHAPEFGKRACKKDKALRKHRMNLSFIRSGPLTAEGTTLGFMDARMIEHRLNERVIKGAPTFVRSDRFKTRPLLQG